MNERIRQLAEQAGAVFTDVHAVSLLDDEIEKFAQLIVRECTGVLFDEAERLFQFYSDESNWISAEEYEIASDQCINNMALIENHFGVEE
jgi:hypothetical protein